MKKIILIIFIIAVAAVAFFIGKGSNQHSTASSNENSAEQKIKHWVAPMDPNYKSDQPGKSPMGMDLVPVYEEDMEAGTIFINPAVINNIGVKSEKLGLQNINESVNTVGYVQVNDDKVVSINSYSYGWIRDLSIKAVGEKVSKGQLLFSFFSPDVVNAEKEYLLALKYNNDSLAQSGKNKLQTLGVSQEEIDEITKSKKAKQQTSVYASIDGYVTSLPVKQGQHITPNMALMTIADLSNIWVIAEVYEKQVAQVKVGQEVAIDFPSLPGKSFKGKVDYIYPQLNAKTRTQRLRVELANADTQLKPDMYANLIINNPGHNMVLAIPKQALIRLGDSNRVVLSLGKGRFKSVAVTTGAENSKWVEIKSGLKAGDEIVTSSQFLIDSESSLKIGLDRISQETIDEADEPPSEPADVPAMQHHHNHG